MSSERRRVVITGVGLISPLGNTKEALWEALLAGRSGVVRLDDGRADVLPTPFGGICREFQGEIDDFGPLEGEKKRAIRKGLKVMSRECQMGVAAAERAITDAGLCDGGHDPERTGVVFGTDFMCSEPEEFTQGIEKCTRDDAFHFEQWAEQGLPQMTPLWLLKYLPNMPASHVAIYNDLRGPNNSLTLREAAGCTAIGEALRVIERGHADAMVVGACGTRLHPMKSVQTACQEEVAPATNGNGSIDPAEASRPFDRDRTGMVLGEGAGAFVLEELEKAKARGATIYAEVVGAGSSSAADRNRVALRDLALANAARGALRDAGATPWSVGHVQAHGIATRSGDEAEARAIRDVFGGLDRPVPVTAAKSYFGNLGAGSGLVELIAGVLALQHDRLFATRNYRTPDPACAINVAAEPQSPGDSFLKLSVTPQGQAACVLVRRYQAAHR
jgi:3-oxoacyl-[acyl-carrier-protein] synthase II